MQEFMPEACWRMWHFMREACWRFWALLHWFILMAYSHWTKGKTRNPAMLMTVNLCQPHCPVVDPEDWLGEGYGLPSRLKTPCENLYVAAFGGHLFTVRNSSCGKVMFSQMSVILSGWRGAGLSLALIHSSTNMLKWVWASGFWKPLIHMNM